MSFRRLRWKQGMAAVLAGLGLAASLSGCAAQKVQEEENGKLQVVATLFPQYDFARQVAGDLAQVTLLMPPGVESHSFEPTPQDMVTIENADLFIYTGDVMEPWAQSILDGVGRQEAVLDVSSGITLEPDGVGDGEEDGHEHGGLDPHIWTSPVLAQKMVENIRDALCEKDPGHAEDYQANAESYLEQLKALDQEFREIVSTGKRQEIVFAGRFAFHYFVKEYGLDYVAAYDSCSHESEPSARAVAEIVERIRADQIPVVYYEELVDPKVARSISEETGAKTLLLHSCHNVSKEEFERGEGYLSLMQQNAKNLREGLN